MTCIQTTTCSLRLPPGSRYLPVADGVRGGKNGVKLPLLEKLLPTAMFDARMSRVFGLDRLGKG